MGVGVVFPDVVAVLGDGGMGRQLLKPKVVVMVQPGLIVVNKNRGSDVHGVAEYKSFGDAAFLQALLYVGGDVDEGPACRDMEP